MNGRLEWPDPTPDGPTPEEEREMEAARECQRCDGHGRVEVYTCKGVCECDMCPEIEDCPECCGQIECDDISRRSREPDDTDAVQTHGGWIVPEHELKR